MAVFIGRAYVVGSHTVSIRLAEFFSFGHIVSNNIDKCFSIYKPSFSNDLVHSSRLPHGFKQASRIFLIFRLKLLKHIDRCFLMSNFPFSNDRKGSLVPSHFVYLKWISCVGYLWRTIEKERQVLHFSFKMKNVNQNTIRTTVGQLGWRMTKICEIGVGCDRLYVFSMSDAWQRLGC